MEELEDCTMKKGIEKQKTMKETVKEKKNKTRLGDGNRTEKQRTCKRGIRRRKGRKRRIETVRVKWK